MLMSTLKYDTLQNTSFKTSKISNDKLVKRISENIQQKNGESSSQIFVVAVIIVVIPWLLSFLIFIFSKPDVNHDATTTIQK